MADKTFIVIAGNFTVDPVADSLGFWIRQLRWTDEIYVASYNQVFQSLLDESGPFGTNTRGFNILLVRPDRLEKGTDLEAAVQTYRARGGVPLIVEYCPVPGEGASHLVPGPFDPHAEELGDVPYTPLFFAALGTSIARKIHGFRTRPLKVIALDCDNTLWKGTCGEDGPTGVIIDEPRRYLQSFKRAQREAGVLLTLASKNNEADVIETFAAHPEMPLRLDDFVTHRINWESKGLNIAAMADELGLGLDSFILVDDNPREIAEVKAACPDVLCLELPHNEARIAHFLDHVWAFDHLHITGEDRQRNESYRQQVERGKLERQTGTLKEFLAELSVEVHIQPMTGGQVPRIVQLTQRTNQMNTTLIRRTEQEVRAAECLTVDVNDRFGSYGLVGAIFLSERDDALVVDSLMLSCRALGRGVEHRMLAHVGAVALSRGKGWVEIPVVVGPRNQPALEFVRGFPNPISAAQCASVEYAPRAVGATCATPTPVKSDRLTIDYSRIARELSRPSQILDAIRVEKRTVATRRDETEQPRTELEHRLAAVWSEVLHVAHPGVHEDFFDLGGHSLLAVQLLSRIRHELEIDLSLDLLYSGKLTISTMASAVELAQADPEELSRLMAEIDSLSDDEIRELLAEN